jgi:hypothetical protein
VACFSEAANLAMFKNYNGAISKTSAEYSNLSIKEHEDKSWTGFGDGELNSDAYAALVKAKVAGAIVNSRILYYINTPMSSVQLSK